MITEVSSRHARRTPADCDVGSIVVGLVNNMPDSALEFTQRQFHELLSAAGRGHQVSVRMFSLPEVPRGPMGRLYVDRNYENVSELWSSEVDGLIVTGTRPRADALADEPYWPAFTKLIDWAEAHTSSAIWSCLAAHAAVLHLDGIVRRPLRRKLSGLFECVRVANDQILDGAPPRWHIPHSRYNDLPEQALVSQGYRVLSRSVDAGVDTFARKGRSFFLFFQGHPEYDPGALTREYRRDVERFVSGKAVNYPEMPRGVFDPTAIAALDSVRRQAVLTRHADVLPDLSAALPNVGSIHSWRYTAVRIYENWLSCLAERKIRNSAPSMSPPAPDPYRHQNANLREAPSVTG
jgi:homoserine O-succinyltransferase/O-acetyltransferase